MTPSQHERLSELFLEARRLPADKQPAFVDATAGSDPELRARLERMLSQEDAGLLDQPVMRVDPGSSLLEGITHDVLEAEQSVPQTIGPYDVLGVLGTGGMSIVYRARQRQPERVVALKILRPSLLTRGALRRFHFEAQTLARLRHPNIAQIYDAGAIEDVDEPRPYFAMELVEGAPLTHARASLERNERLDRILQACDAVAYAHQKGVLHRDLKPSNILVDGEGSVRVLDFGVARALVGARETHTHATRAGQLIGTLAYMSPEQVSGDIDDLDTRSDLYALGVLAYELLTGHLPYDLERVGLARAARIISETVPRPMSTRDMRLRGDLEIVVAKALEKDRAARYPSVSAFADDLRRVLRNEPILARRPSVSYQVRKFVARNRGFSLMVAVTGLALIVGATLATWGMVSANERRIEAEQALARAVDAEEVAGARLVESQAAQERSALAAKVASEVSRFLMKVLSNADPTTHPERAAALRGILEDAEGQIRDGRFDASSRVKAALMRIVGRAYVNLDRLDAGERNLRDAISLYEEDDVRPVGKILSARSELTRLLWRRGQHEQAAQLAEETYAQRIQTDGPDHHRTLQIANRLAVYYTDLGRFAEAESLFLDSLKRGVRTLDPQHSLIGSLHSNLARLYSTLARFDDAEPHSIRAIEIMAKRNGLRNPRILGERSRLARIELARGRLDTAEELYRENATIGAEILGPLHSLTLSARFNLGNLLIYRGQYDQAIERLEAVYADQITAFGDRHPDGLYTALVIATAYREAGRLTEAEQHAQYALQAFSETLGVAHPQAIKARIGLARILARRGETDAALNLLSKSWNAAPPSDAEDAQQIREAVAQNPRLQILVGEALAEAYEQAEAFDAALDAYQQTAKLIGDTFGQDTWEYASSQVAVGRCLILIGRSDEALSLLEEACPQLATILGDEHPYVVACRALLE